MQIEHALVTGAAGFLGQNLVQTLLDRDVKVRALVRNTPLQLSHPQLECVSGDVTDKASLVSACEGIDTVFHTAAFMGTMGGSAVTKAYRDEAFRITEGGAKNIVAACKEQGVQRLVHTSSVDVCFNQEENLNMDEHTPYATNHYSSYTASKIAAEKVIRAANDENGLLTCSLRPDGIWGSGECRMFQELVDNIISGPLPVRVAGMGAVHDHVHVDNLIHAHILAAEKLKPGSPVNGNAYFISDGNVAPLFEFVRPFFAGLGREVPRFSIPAAPLYWTTAAWQWLHFKVGIPKPMLTPHEVNKATISHVISSEAATRDFGYQPVKSVAEGLQEAAEYYKDRL